MIRKDIKGLDTLRFVAALCVAFSHGIAFPLGSLIPKDAGIWRAFVALNELSFNGPAAVIVFFVISGFCIHYGFACGMPFRTVPFWLRRGLRIAPPLAAAILIASFLGPEAKGALGVVLWSVYCELIYYALYPALRWMFAKFGLRVLVLGSFVVAAIFILLHWEIRYHWALSIYWTWLVGLPAWLLGCLLAEHTARISDFARTGRIWIWRFGVWCYATFALVLFLSRTFSCWASGIVAALLSHMLFLDSGRDQILAKPHACGFSGMG